MPVIGKGPPQRYVTTCARNKRITSLPVKDGTSHKHVKFDTLIPSGKKFYRKSLNQNSAFPTRHSKATDAIWIDLALYYLERVSQNSFDKFNGLDYRVVDNSR